MSAYMAGSSLDGKGGKDRFHNLLIQIQLFRITNLHGRVCYYNRDSSLLTNVWRCYLNTVSLCSLIIPYTVYPIPVNRQERLMY